MSTSSILDSGATFEQQASEAGYALKHHQMGTFSKLSFAITTPGTTAQDADIRNFLGSIRPGLNPTIADLSAFKRILFEEQTLSIHNLKTVVKRDEGSARRMAPPECEARLARQRTLLRGIDITGPLQPAHGLYDLCTSMIEKNEISYISPTRCLSTNRNLQGLSQIRNYSLMPRRQLSFWRSSSPRWKFRWPRTWLCIRPFNVVL